MNKNYVLLFLLLNYSVTFSQLGFCSGSSGAPIFFENFGSGLNYGPALPAGVTNYTYVNSGFPQDGQYTLYHRTNLIPNSQNWLFSLDHTPDNQADGLNGKCLIVNASNTPGQFYNRTVTGLCSNTTFEFSAWVLNILNASTNGLPINVTFEIWDATDTMLLKTGSTGNIANTFTPVWNQFGLVFTMPIGQTSVILKMRNNGVGGNGNDLAIDDIMFRACGEFSSITNSGNPSSSITICQNETITNNILQVSTTGTSAYIYQWQQSNDNINFTDIAGQNTNTYLIPNITTTTFYRVKVANDIANINNNFCSTLSDVFPVNVTPLPSAPVSNGDQTKCANQNTTLSVTVNGNESVDWYDAPSGGNLLQANSTSYSTSILGTYYAEAYNISFGCKSATRVAVSLLPMVTLTYNGPTTICSGETTAITTIPSDNTYTINWTATSTDVIGFSNGTGTTIAQTLTYSGTTAGTVTYVIKPIKNGCEGISETVIVTVNPITNIAPVFNGIPTSYCIYASAPTLPTSSNNATPIVGTWTPSNINTSVAGTFTYTFNAPPPNACENILPYTLTVTIDSNFTPNFTSTINLCSGTTPPQLNPVSPNGISGTWNPPTIDNMVSGNYTFTPDPNQCAVSQTISVSITPTNTTISYTGPTTICSTETTALNLTASDANAVINWTATSTDVTGFADGSGNIINQTLTYTGNSTGTVTYSVTPILNGCSGITEIITVIVNPQTSITPTFAAIPTTYCLNATTPVLPTSSTNNTPIIGTWNPATINTASVGTTTYTFTPQANPCINYTVYTLNITVSDNNMPNFNDTIALCSGTNPPTLNSISPNGISGTWNPSSINNMTSGSYTFTPNANQCAVPQTINVVINQATLTSINYSISSAFTENQIITVLATSPGDYLYQLDNGNFQESNVFTNVSDGIHTITVIDQNGCSEPLSETLIVVNYPKFFTPNGDGINDFWSISGSNTLQKPKISIFDRYGKLLYQFTNNVGWDGTFNGYNLPADDYWFTIDFEENNIPRIFKAHFSLLR